MRFRIPDPVSPSGTRKRGGLLTPRKRGANAKIFRFCLSVKPPVGEASVAAERAPSSLSWGR
jgi:hypothetical protein